jgi:aspartyl-tRNA synthetase
MERVLIENLNQHAGQTVTIKGWIDVRRDQGKMVFLISEITQGKFKELFLLSRQNLFQERRKCVMSS